MTADNDTGFETTEALRELETITPPEIFQELRREVSRYAHRQRVLPGITGWARVNHSYDQSVDDVRTKVRYDLEYIERRSVAEDVRIMARTLPVMIGRKGAI